MTFERLGRIFDPHDHALPDGCVSFAQSPQTLMLDDGIRVYFSTRSVDAQGGKFKSRIAYADFASDLRTIRAVSDHTVIELGGLGCFDEHGIFPMNVLRVGDQVRGYTCGWNRRVSVSVDTGIGLALSDDGGRTFVRQGDGPVLGPSLHEPFLVGDGFVLQSPQGFHMWYIFGQRWSRQTPEAAPDRVYKIAQARSTDGVVWHKTDGHTILPDVLGPDECQALPSVAKLGDRYHMVFCYREVFGFRSDPTKGYRLGYAWSQDLETWHRDDAALGFHTQAEEWDADMQCYPHVFVHDDALHILYNGNAFGKDGFGLARFAPQ